MKPDDIDEFLARAAERVQAPDGVREEATRAERVILSNLRPVRPLASQRRFTAILLVVFATIALLAATILGLHGVQVLSPIQRGVIFGCLSIAAWTSAIECARGMRPAGGASFGGKLIVITVLGFPLLFAVVFRGYQTWHFVTEGVPCLIAGLCVSMPTGVMVAYILRRGFLMAWSKAGLAAGTLSGLTGLAMLELHCSNLKAIHVMFWHVAVVVASGLLGLVIGRIADAIRSYRG